MKEEEPKVTVRPDAQKRLLSIWRFSTHGLGKDCKGRGEGTQHTLGGSCVRSLEEPSTGRDGMCSKEVSKKGCSQDGCLDKKLVCPITRSLPSQSGAMQP